MKITITEKREVEIKAVRIEAPFRHIGDDEDSDVPNDFPLLKGKVWHATIDLDTHKIRDWPLGQMRSLYTKVCDAGSYYLLDENEKVVTSINQDYVPNNLIPGEWGDYIEMIIEGDGTISNWSGIADFSDFEEREED